MLNKLSQHLITAHRTLFRNKICLDIMCFALIGLLDEIRHVELEIVKEAMENRGYTHDSSEERYS